MRAAAVRGELILTGPETPNLLFAAGAMVIVGEGHAVGSTTVYGMDGPLLDLLLGWRLPVPGWRRAAFEFGLGASILLGYRESAGPGGESTMDTRTAPLLHVAANVPVHERLFARISARHRLSRDGFCAVPDGGGGRCRHLGGVSDLAASLGLRFL